MANVFTLVCEQNGWEISGSEATVPIGENRHQTVHHSVTKEDGQQVLRIHTVIGSAAVLDEVRMRAALGINARMRYGAFAILDDDLVLTDSFLLPHTDPTEVSASIGFLARKADDYERLIYGTDAH